MKLLFKFFVLAVSLLSVSCVSTQMSPMIPLEAKEWELKIAIFPPDENSIVRVTVTHAGEWDLYARDTQGEAFEETRQLRKRDIFDIYEASEAAIVAFRMQQLTLLSEEEFEELFSKTCSVDVTLRIGGQRVMVDSGPMLNLTERPHLKNLVGLIAEQLPENLEITLP